MCALLSNSQSFGLMFIYQESLLGLGETLPLTHEMHRQSSPFTATLLCPALSYSSLCGLYRCCLVTKSRLALCDPMDCSMPGFPILHCLLEFDQTHVHWVGGDIQPSHLLLPPSPPVPNLCSWPTSGSFPMNWLFTSSVYFSIITDELRVNKWLWCFGVKKKYNYADTLKMTISLIQGGEFMYMRLVNL